MSRDLREAIKKKQSYLNSGVDDLESLYWAFLWAMVSNIYNQPCCITGWQNRLKGTVRDRTFASLDIIGGYLEPSEHSTISDQFAPFLNLWWTKICQLRYDWKCRTALQTIPLHKGKFWPSQYHEFAYRGVCDILEVVKEHRNRISQFPSFVRQLDDSSAPSQHSATKRGRDEDDKPVPSLRKRQKGTVDS